MDHDCALGRSLRQEIDELRREVERLKDISQEMKVEQMTETTQNVYVFEDDGDEARAFDEFYRAYDEVHAKTRKFLLG